MTDPTAPPPTDALQVAPNLVIPRGELTFKATRSGGAGGQNVNKVASRIELTWNPARSAAVAALDEATRAHLMSRLAARLDGDGDLRVVSSEMRSQLQNRTRAEERLAELLRKALAVPKRRRPTKPSKAAKRKRLEEKKRNSEKKAARRFRE